MSSDLEQTQIRVVNASAGSGKTYALAKRYVQILLSASFKSPQSLKHILAITFTNKAAGQMKERIIALLKKIALEQISKEQQQDILKPIGLSLPQAKQAATVVMEDIIRYYHYFNVSTIHSFMNKLLAGCAFKMNLSARFKIKRNFKDYLLLALDEFIDQAGHDSQVRKLFERFIMQYLFLENRSNWFPKKDLMGVLVILFKQLNTYQRPLLKFDVSDKDILRLKKDFIDLVAAIVPMFPEGADKRFVNALTEFTQQHPNGFDIDQLSRYFSRTEIPASTGTKMSKTCEQTWEKITSTLNQIVLCEAYAVFNPYVDLFLGVMEILGRIQEKEDVLFLEQLNKKAGELFTNDLVSVAEVYCRLATRFNHYLIDEFQDTAQSEWQNIKPMVQEALASGGSLFYVGDKKQAIYGFRGGKSYLFDQLQEELKQFPISKETLTTNYRSSRYIVAFNNHIFSQDNLMRMVNELETQNRFKDKGIAFTPEDRESMNSVFKDAHQNPIDPASTGHVRVEIISGKKKEDRQALIKEKVIAAVNDAKHRYKLHDIAILTRNNDEVEEVTSWLITEGIAAQSERTSDITTHWLTQQLMTYLRFLHNPMDNEAFVNFIISDIYTSASGMKLKDIEAFLFSNRVEKKFNGQFSFYQVFKGHYPQEAQKYFEPFLSQVGVYPLYEMALNVCEQMGCLTHFKEEQGFIMHWLELIKRQEEEGCDLETFLNYFDALETEDQMRFVSIPSIEAVVVLTIHKSKGLEYPCVIIPYLEMTIKVGSGDKNGGQSFLWDETPDGLRLFRLKESYTQFCPLLKDRYAYEYKQCFKSELNNMYVALTRAIDEMVILIPEKVGNSSNVALGLIPEAMYAYGEVKNAKIHTTTLEKPALLAPAVFKPWVGGWTEQIEPLSLENLEKRHRGEIIHFCLSRIANIHGQNIDRIIAFAVGEAKALFKIKGDGKDYQVYFKNLLAKSEWTPFFDLPDDVQIMCEQEIVNRYGDSKRIDRLIVFNDKVWAVDFKPTENQALHTEQINAYVQLLKDLYPKKKVEGFILHYAI